MKCLVLLLVLAACADPTAPKLVNCHQRPAITRDVTQPQAVVIVHASQTACGVR